MKTILVITAVMGLSASAAFAECSYHKVNASVEVDKTITTASVQSEKTSDEALILTGQVPAAEQQKSE